MALIKVKTREEQKVKIVPVEEEDYKALTKKRYHFSWKSFKGHANVAVYKLQIPGEDDILGVMALIDFPRESRIEISLLACSLENVGENKTYEGIAGNLIAYAGRLAVKRYGKNACLSLVPKTRLKKHYIDKYGMLDAGWQLFLEGKVLNDIILKYLL
ncbi:N-acetyltransferase [Taibaiella koreensis]|uniref:N-acetyltransferase n=1 Tax=Taibaiella koreensis TaxID=1268548 RepID=UPI000E59A223|nr:N-acetyltransferase [Taibaiella koreensis]